MPSAPVEFPGQMIPGEAAADLSAGQYRAVVIDSNGQFARAGAGVAIAGVQQNKPAAQGRAISVMKDGVSKAEAGAAITAGAKVTTDANGKFVAATTGDFVSGFAWTAAGADGEIFSLWMNQLDVSA